MAERLWQRLQAGLEGLSELETVTVVGAEGAEGLLSPAGSTRQQRRDGRRAALGEILRQGGTVYLTRVNMLSGDVVTVVPTSDADDPMRAFHGAQVATGREVYARNLELVARLLRELSEHLPQEELRPTADPDKPVSPGGAG